LWLFEALDYSAVSRERTRLRRRIEEEPAPSKAVKGIDETCVKGKDIERFLRYILLLAGIVLGCAHLWLALKAMFVFRNDEPSSMWNLIMSGPLSTLPAVIVSYFWPKIGGAWLILGSVLSFLFAIASMQTDRNLHDIVWYFTAYSGPMLVLGIGTIFCATSKSK
jgi:hypothetical protein